MNVKRFQNMALDRLDSLIAQFPDKRIAVFGDFFLDKYLDIDETISDVSVESGKAAHQVVSIRTSPGCAGTVANNLSTLGTAKLCAIGFTGADGEGYDLRVQLERIGCVTEGLFVAEDRLTPTYLKPREIHDKSLYGEYERYDTKNRTTTPERVIEKCLTFLDTALPDLDAVIIADQVEMDDCGLITSQTRAELAERARAWPQVVFWADSRRHIDAFRNIIIKPNQFETVGHTSPIPEQSISVEEIIKAIPRLREITQAPICVTLGSNGILTSDPELTLVPGVSVDGPVDITGAGDSASAGAVLALTAGATLPEAALIGNLVASITIKQLAETGTAKAKQLIKQLEVWNQQQEK